MQNKSLVKLVFRYLPILIGAIVLMPTTLIQSQTMVVQQPKKQKRKLPSPPAPKKDFPANRSDSASQTTVMQPLPPPPTPKRDFPANRSVSASQGTCDLKLVALAPEFKRTTANQITETHVWGQTTISNPTLWFFIPSAPPGTKLEFSLQDRQEQDIYRSSITTPTQPGVIGIQLPAGQPLLQLNRDYRWTLTAKVPCDNAEPTRVHVDGWIARVNLAVGYKNMYNYAREGIWYDAVTSLAQERLQKPNDPGLKQDWIDLLKLVNLNQIADRPLLKHNSQK